MCVGKKEVGRAKTDPYCKARERLPETLLADLARHSGAELQREVPAPQLLGGRPIKIADGRRIKRRTRSSRRRRRAWAFRSCVWWA